MISKAEYDAQIARLSDKPCGLAMAGRETVAKCDPPTLDNRRCAMCGMLLWKYHTGEAVGK